MQLGGLGVRLITVVGVTSTCVVSHACQVYGSRAGVVGTLRSQLSRFQVHAVRSLLTGVMLYIRSENVFILRLKVCDLFPLIYIYIFIIPQLFMWKLITYVKGPPVIVWYCHSTTECPCSPFECFAFWNSHRADGSRNVWTHRKAAQKMNTGGISAIPSPSLLAFFPF